MSTLDRFADGLLGGTPPNTDVRHDAYMLFHAMLNHGYTTTHIKLVSDQMSEFARKADEDPEVKL